MEKEKKYRITWEQQQPDGTWETQEPIETEGFLLMADKNGDGMTGLLMNLSTAELMLMISHFTKVRKIILDNILPLMLAEKYFDEKGAPEELTDAESMLTHVAGARKKKKGKK